MVDVAMSKGIDEIWLLDHTHKFKEFSFLYSTLKENLTVNWYQKKVPISVHEYIDFIKEVKMKKWPITVKFGLEICYFPEHEEQLRNTLQNLPTFDFLVGSTHFEFGAGIDLKKEIVERFDINELYIEYFRINECAIKSHLFTVIGHPDLVKYFGFYPERELYLSIIDNIARCFAENNQLAENNPGLLRYGFLYPGLSSEMLEAFDKYGVKYHKSSDAHTAKDIGRAFDKLISNY